MLDKLEPISENYVPVDDSDIKRIQEITQTTLPHDYIEFIRKYGRSMFVGEATVTSKNKKMGIFTFFGGGNDDGSVIRDIEAHEEFPSNGIIPIADDMFNNRYVIEGDTGKISFIEYTSGTADVFEVSNSFSELLELIEVEEDE